ncbi:MAG: glycosyltransferase, partial [Ginsengibacter sp.]
MNEKVPLVSVLVITFNHERYISKCIESVLKQVGDFQVELIISNDQSTDKTDLIIQKQIDGYFGPYKIKYFNQEKNLGIVPNLLFAWQQCTGDYVALCEGDDYWQDQKKLQKQLDIFSSSEDCSMVITNRIVERVDGTTYLESYDDFYGKHNFTTNDIINDFIPGLQTMMSKNFPDFRIFMKQQQGLTHCDRYLAYYASMHGKILLLPEATATYRMTGYGAWSSNSGLQKKQVKVKQLQDFHKRIGLPINNSITAMHVISCGFVTLKYCLKRPSQLTDPEN